MTCLDYAKKHKDNIAVAMPTFGGQIRRYWTALHNQGLIDMTLLPKSDIRPLIENLNPENFIKIIELTFPETCQSDYFNNINGDNFEFTFFKF